jgi:hypothetical protein
MLAPPVLTSFLDMDVLYVYTSFLLVSVLAGVGGLLQVINGGWVLLGREACCLVPRALGICKAGLWLCVVCST